MIINMIVVKTVIIIIVYEYFERIWNLMSKIES